MTTFKTPNGVRVDSGINLGFSFKPTIAVSAKNFDTLDLDLRSMREPLKRCVQRVIAPSIGRNFLVGGRPTWQPLSEATLQLKGQAQGVRYPVADPLLRTGLLFKTMQQLNIWTITSNQAAILDLPDKIWYGKLHQEGYGTASSSLEQSVRTALGGGAKRAFIPARPFAMVQPKDVDAIQAEFEIWLNERIIARLGL
jgi:phage gpG-like protein